MENACRSPNSTPYALTFWPSRVTSDTPSATSASISARISPGRRSFSLPRSAGTMQNVQVLLHPTETDTHAAYADCRLVGSVEGKTSSDSRISTCASSCTRARSSSTGSEPMLWVPKTTSTYGALAVIVERSFCARQPPTAICMPGLAALIGARWREVAVELVVGVLADRAGVEDDHVGLLADGHGGVPGILEQAGEALGVVDVHLAPVGADLVGARLRRVRSVVVHHHQEPIV